MAEKNDITVIIPVHEYSEDLENYFPVAIRSIENQLTMPDKVMVVASKDDNLINYLNNFDYGEIQNRIQVVENEISSDFPTQINYGVSQVDTEWFNILEFDDELANIWIKNAVKYKDVYGGEVDAFLPIIVDVDHEGKFAGFTNEAVWATDFSDERGMLDNGALLRYHNFSLDGLLMRKEVFEEFGGLKPSMKLTFIYEFFLRMTYNDVKFMTIPKFAYKHINQREGSLFHQYQQEMDPTEAKWWFSQAKKEYFFIKDRNIQYEDNNE